MNYAEKLKHHLVENSGKVITEEEVKLLFSPDNAEELAIMYSDINRAIESGDIIVSKKRKYMLPSTAGLIKGRIQANEKGFAFLIPDDSDDDVFLPPRKLLDAFDGDIVYVKKTSNGGDRRPEGEVTKVISRARYTVVGTYSASKNFGFVTPDDKRFFKDIFVSKSKTHGAKSGDKVIVHIDNFCGRDENPEGTVTEILGKSTDIGVDILSIIKSHRLRSNFPAEVMAEAEQMPTEVSPSELENRRDFTSQTIITIDGEDARDLDDAVSVTKTQDGNFTLSVHIADVSHYVKSHSAINKEALARGTSIYFPDRVLPMLPVQLSNNICSLNENVHRLTLSAIMTIDHHGKIIAHEVTKGLIKTKHRMTYTSVTKILQGDEAEREKYADVIDMLLDMEKLAEILSAKRTARGSIDFDMPECKIIMGDDGKIKDIVPYERTVSNRMIEEFMIAANETVAEYMSRLELPFIYRVHEKPSEEKMYNFKQLLKAIGVQLKVRGEIHAKLLLQILDSVREQSVFPVVNRSMLRAMQKAKYSPDNIGHFGLGSKYYCHFTSPIRRYPDLMIHRIITMMLDGKLDENACKKINASIYDIANSCSECEKQADEAERDADNLKKAEFMQDKIGMCFDGVISGVTSFGIFVELKNTVEGIIRIDNLPKDVYNYMENTYSLVGSKHSYRLGDCVSIKVSNVNLDNMKVEFVLNEDNCSQ